MLLFAPSGDEQSLFVTDKASPGLILFSGLKTFFFFPSCVISVYLLEMAAFLTAVK